MPFLSPSYLGIRDLQRLVPSSTNWQQITLTDGLEYVRARTHYAPLFFFFPPRAVCELCPGMWQHLSCLGSWWYTFVIQERSCVHLRCTLEYSLTLKRSEASVWFEWTTVRPFWIAWSGLLAAYTKWSYWDSSSPHQTPSLGRFSQPKKTSNTASADIPMVATAQGKQGTE